MVENSSQSSNYSEKENETLKFLLWTLKELNKQIKHQYRMISVSTYIFIPFMIFIIYQEIQVALDGQYLGSSTILYIVSTALFMLLGIFFFNLKKQNKQLNEKLESTIIKIREIDPEWHSEEDEMKSINNLISKLNEYTN